MLDVLGYARISTSDHDLDVQRRRLREEAGAIRIFEGVIFGRGFERPGLAEPIKDSHAGDIVCVVRLDRRSRNSETVDGFETLAFAFRSGNASIPPRPPASGCSTSSAPSRSSSRA